MRVEVHRERVAPPVLELGLVGRRAAEHAHARVVHEDVDATEPGDDVVDEPMDLRGIADVDDVALGLSPGAFDLVDDRGDSVRPQVDDRNARAFVSEQMGGRAAHATRRAGDDRDLACDRSRELGQPGLGHVRSGIGKWTPGMPCWLMVSASGVMPE